MKIFEFYRQNEFKIVVLAGLIASLVYSLFIFGLPWRFNSPDEMANAYFAKRIASGLSLSVPLSDQSYWNLGIIHPRSVSVIGNSIIPSSFIGLPLAAGVVGMIFGTSALPFVTPLFACVGLVSFFYLLKEYFDSKLSWSGLLLLAALPSFWYYHSRSFFHNAIFFDLVLLGMALFVYLNKASTWWRYLLSGLVIGLAMIFRTSEIFWLTAALGLWWFLRRQELNTKFILYFLIGIVVGFLPTVVANFYLYGHPFSVGYDAGLFFPQASLKANTWLVKELILPFGFSLKNIWHSSVKYLIQLMPWWGILAILAWLKILIDYNKLNINLRKFIWPALLMCGWLVVLYGSWLFVDSPNPADVTLGTSYARYWLPIYVISLVPILYLFKWIITWPLGKYITLVALVIYVGASAYLVWWQPLEGLQAIRSNIMRFENISESVQGLTESDSLIVVERTDKIFWPERNVIFALANSNDFAKVSQLLNAGKNVYKFQPVLSAKDLDDLNQDWLAKYYLELEPVTEQNWSGYTLYRIIPGGL